MNQQILLSENREGQAEKENKLEMIFSSHKLNDVMHALRSSHPYEEIAYDLIPLLNDNRFEGADGGRSGRTRF